MRRILKLQNCDRARRGIRPEDGFFELEICGMFVRLFSTTL